MSSFACKAYPPGSLEIQKGIIEEPNRQGKIRALGILSLVLETFLHSRHNPYMRAGVAEWLMRRPREK